MMVLEKQWINVQEKTFTKWYTNPASGTQGVSRC